MKTFKEGFDSAIQCSGLGVASDTLQGTIVNIRDALANMAVLCEYRSDEAQFVELVQAEVRCIPAKFQIFLALYCSVFQYVIDMFIDNTESLPDWAKSKHAELAQCWFGLSWPRPDAIEVDVSTPYKVVSSFRRTISFLRELPGRPAAVSGLQGRSGVSQDVCWRPKHGQGVCCPHWPGSF